MSTDFQQEVGIYFSTEFIFSTVAVKSIFYDERGKG